MLKRVAIVMCALAVSVSAYAQQNKAATPAKKPSTNAEQVKPEAKPEPAAKPVPEPPSLPINIRVEVSITDQSGTNPPAKKTVSMIVGDRQRNYIRSSASVLVKTQYRNVTINVDARPTIISKEPNKISLGLALEYQPKSAGGAEELEPGMAQLNEQMTLILESGKTITVSQAADPTSDRKITVDVTATILK